MNWKLITKSSPAFKNNIYGDGDLYSEEVLITNGKNIAIDNLVLQKSGNITSRSTLSNVKYWQPLPSLVKLTNSIL